MRIKLKRFLKGWVFLFLFVLLATGSFGATFNITTSRIPSLDHDDVALTAASVIQVYSGRISNPDDTGGLPADRVLAFDGGISPVFDAAGNLDFFGIAAVAVGDYIFVRIWEGDPGSAADSYYRDVEWRVAATPVQTINIGGDGEWNLNTSPPAPESIGTFSERLVRRVGTENYDLQLSYTITAPVTDAPVDGYEVQVRKQGPGGVWPDWPAGALADHPNFFRSGAAGFTPIDAYFTRGTTYQYRARAYNYLGSGGWAEDASYVYEALGGAIVGPGAGPLAVTYNFATAPPLGVNQFAIPMGAVGGDAATPLNLTYTYRDGSAHTIDTVADLVAAINDFGGGLGVAARVTTFGWWDEAAQLPRGYTFDAAGAATASAGIAEDPATEYIERDRVYQINVDNEIAAFRLSGERE